MNGVCHSSSGVLCSKESNLMNFLRHQIAPNVFCSIELIIFKILALSMLLLWICSCACISLDERCTLLDERRRATDIKFADRKEPISSYSLQIVKGLLSTKLSIANDTIH